jgi:hypothetical protein
MSRLASAVVFVVTGGVLFLSFWLVPDGAGHGTHTQLGLNPCSVLEWTGYPCPMCGMTTTFTLMAHGKVVTAFVNQPFGVVLFLITVTTFVVSLVEMVRPRFVWKNIWEYMKRYEGRLVSAFFVGLVLGWAYKIWLMTDG